jgi:hypothetical protein
MPFPLRYSIDWPLVIWAWAVLFNLGAGLLNLWVIRRMLKHSRRSLNLYEDTLLEAEELRQRAECIVAGHQWGIETKDLQNPEDKEMTVLVKCECQLCHTRLDFEVRFGLHRLGPNQVGAWANILPTRPPG